MADSPEPENVEIGSDLFGRWADDEQYGPPIVAEPVGGNVPGSDDEVDEDAPVVPNVLMDLREASNADDLRAYWVHGKGAAKIRWGQPHDFDRCVRQLGRYVTDPEGLCNRYHVAATGHPPGEGH